MKKILYIDFPFINAQNQDSKRSQFIWEIVSKNFNADLLLIKTREFLTKPHTNPDGYNEVFTLATSIVNPFKAKAVYQFSKENLDKFVHILQRKCYDIIFLHGISCAELVFQIEKTLPGCNLVIDADYLLSKQAEQLWLKNPTKKNLRQKFEYIQLKRLENALFKRGNQYYFSNNKEMTLAMSNASINQNKQNFKVLPNVLPKVDSAELKLNITEAEKALLADKFILFFGNLSAPENIDAFTYLAKEIYPRISKKIQEKDIKIYIVGNNGDRIYEQYSGGRLKLIGAVANLYAYIKASLFVILPIRTGSGAMSRILESAIMKKTVLTTSQGAEGLDFTIEEIAIEDKIDNYCLRLTELIQSPGKATEMGQNLCQKAKDLYNRKAIEKSLIDNLNQLKSKPVSRRKKSGIKIAVITNGFLNSENDVDALIYSQIQKLAELYDVSVYCPLRTKSPGSEVVNNITIHRLMDILNYPKEFPNYKTKTRCPSLFLQLMKNDFDLILCYPGINSNNELALLAAKIKDIPIMLISMGILDYRGMFKAQEQIDPEILQSLNLSKKDRMFIKNLDYIFTVSEKEYIYLRKLNERIEQVPVPFSEETESSEQISLRDKYKIKQDAFVYLCIGAFTFLNGQDVALKAYVKALPHLPETKLVLIGNMDSEPEYVEDIEALIGAESLFGEVIMIQPDELNTVPAWLQEADICLLPARFLMADATTALSWTQGIPVLQSDAVDPNLVIDGYNGYLFRSEDIEDLALQMQKALNNRAKLKIMAEHGRTLVKDNYTMKSVINRYLKIIKQLTT